MPTEEQMDKYAAAIFRDRRYATAVKIKKPKKRPPLPSMVTDEHGRILGYPILVGKILRVVVTRPTDAMDPFTASYTQDAKGNIFRSGKALGKGAFGHVKHAAGKEPEICLKTQVIDRGDIERLATARKEYALLTDLGHTAGEMVERHTPDGRTKIVIPLKDYGQPLDRFCDRPLDDKLSMSIDFLLQVDALHQGRTSRSGKRLAHHDLKPDNVLVDKEGRVHLIDFGLTEEIRANDWPTRHSKGSVDYLAIDFSILQDTKLGATQLFRHEQPTSHKTADTLAAIRCIYHPLESLPRPPNEPPYSLFTQQDFDKLPPALQSLLDTRDIKTFLAKNLDERTVAASLAYYQLTGTFTSDDALMLKVPDMQQRVLQLHAQLKTLELPTSTAERVQFVKIRLTPVMGTPVVVAKTTESVDTPGTLKTRKQLKDLETFLSDQVRRMSPGFFKTPEKTIEKKAGLQLALRTVQAYLVQQSPVTQQQLTELEAQIKKAVDINRGWGLLTPTSSKDFEKVLQSMDKDSQTRTPKPGQF